MPALCMVELRSVLEVSGAPFAVISGTTTMQMLPALNWACPAAVSSTEIVFLKVCNRASIS